MKFVRISPNGAKYISEGRRPSHVFMDQSPQQIETARSLGIQAIHLDKGMKIEEHLFLPKER